MIEKILANNLKDLRKKAGLTQSDMAENAGISLRYYQRIEAMESWPPPDTLKALARALHVTESELMSGSVETTMRSGSSLVPSRAENLAFIVTGLAALNDLEVRAIASDVENFLTLKKIEDKSSSG